jgi:D-alanine-D-alanine ligase
MRVALAFNLKRGASDRDAEFDTPETIDAARRALARRHRVILVEGDGGALLRFQRARPDLVFNMAEGRGGPAREAHVPAVLELLGIPYTGSDPLALNLCLHKRITRDVLSAHGVPIPREGRLPAVVKPLHEGSSKGIRDSSLVRTLAALRREVRRIERDYGQAALVEEFLPGREFTVALLGNPPRTLPIVEIRLDALPSGANALYSYEAKWVWDTPDRPLEIFECPARIGAGLRGEIEALCRRAWNALGLRDWCRIDVRLDGRGRPRVLEVNPLPGILPDPADNSCFPKAARAAGWGYDDLVNRVLDTAAARCGLR